MTVVATTGDSRVDTATPGTPAARTGAASAAGADGLFTCEAAAATFGLDAGLVAALARTGRLRSVTGRDGARRYAAGDLLDVVRSLPGRR